MLHYFVKVIKEAKSQDNADLVYGHKIINGVDIDLMYLTSNYDETTAIAILSSKASISIEEAEVELETSYAEFELMTPKKIRKWIVYGCLYLLLLILIFISGFVAGMRSN